LVYRTKTKQEFDEKKLNKIETNDHENSPVIDNSIDGASRL